MPDSSDFVRDNAASPPLWAGAASAAIGGLAVAWIILGTVVLFMGDDAGASARAMKAVLLACVPVSLAGLVLGLSSLQQRSRWGTGGIVLNGLTLVGAFGVIVLTYIARF